MAPGGNPGTTADTQTPFADGKEEALAALRAEWAHAYEVGINTVADRNGPILLWVAFRLEKRRPKPLFGLTPAALEAAIRDDWGEQP